MLAFFRRILSSWVAVAVFGLIMVAFIVTGIGTPGGGLTGGANANAIAVVGGEAVTDRQVSTQAEGMLRNAQEQQAGLTMPAFLSAVGGLGPIVEQYISGQILSRWAASHGMVVNERLIGSEIASVPAFRGPTGQFDENAMNAILGRQRIPFKELHDGIRDDLLRRQVIGPIASTIRAPEGMLSPYAGLLINRREGQIGTVPLKLDSVARPTDAETATWYRANVARYTLPERRVLRYAAIGPETMQLPAPTEAEIAAAYRADAAKYASGETRAVSQVVLPDEAAAKAFVAQVTGGTAFADVAIRRGLAAADIALGTVTRDALAQASSPALAAAAFAVPSGGTTAPVKGALGWAVAHVDAIQTKPARSLDQARAEITQALAEKKRDDAVTALVARVEDALNDGSTFAEVAAQHKLTVVTTPPLLSNGTAPGDPAFRPDATVTALMRAAGGATPDDDPTVETIDPNQHFALLSVASVVAAAPIPLAEVKDRVAQDVIARRAADRARAIAEQVAAQVRRGQTLAAALAAAKLAPPQSLTVTQADIARSGQPVPPAVRALFRIAAGEVELVPAPGGGWTLTTLNRIVPGDRKLLPLLVAQTRGEIGDALGREYAEQFVNAARSEVKITRNPQALGRLEQQLRGNGTPAQ
ncbi:peptidylprolyl isomerase [uncultured Sphingomonas sp.]|uniref:peptidylprolyl isomerase n=1 Tax=uncultured Sphingomonas sp. TaxID=158754 RepID=UPI0025DB41DA|nr:peptidylprolyl isomerase [uncultured Sphingomonas sp.]